MKIAKFFKKFRWFAILFISSFLFIACASVTNQPTTTQSSTPLKIGHVTSWIGYSPFYVAMEQGFFEEQGLKVEQNVVADETLANAAMVAGKLDGILATINMYLIGADQKQNFKVVGLIDYSKGGDGVVGRVNSLAEAKGKRVAAPLGTPNHALLLHGLNKNGLTKDDVQLINMTVEDATAAYISKTIDITASYQPFMNKAITEGGGKIIYSSAEAPGLITDAVAFSGPALQNRPEDIEKFLKGLMRGVQFIKDNPEEGLKIIATKLEITPEEAKAQLEGVELLGLEQNKTALLDQNSPLYFAKAFEEARTFARQQDLIKSEPTFESMFDLSFLQKLSSSS
jgi:NitT/TauT family transport system substrate-binding protein